LILQQGTRRIGDLEIYDCNSIKTIGSESILMKEIGFHEKLPISLETLSWDLFGT
jgi:hypothetical protein